MAQTIDTIVRPSVLPNIRPPGRPRARPNIPPPPGRALVVGDYPDWGQALLAGSSGQIVKLTISGSNSWSKSKGQEKERIVDVQRVYQKDPETGEVNKENFVELEVAKKMTLQKSDGTEEVVKYTPPTPTPQEDNIETIATDVTIKNPEVQGGSGAP